MIAVMGAHTASFQIVCERHPLPGEYLIGQDFRQILDGGKGSNQAIAAARFGAEVELLSVVGADEEGDKLLEYCKYNGVGCSGVRRSEDKTGAGYAFVDDRGIPMGVTVPGCLQDISEDLVTGNEALIEKADVFLAQLEVPVQTALAGCRMAHDKGALTILNPAPADALKLGQDMSYIDVLTPNENEARRLAGIIMSEGVSPGETARRIYERSGIPVIIITLGEKGALICQNGNVSLQPAFPVKAIETSGAGDCFNAVLACLLEEGKDIHSAVRHASAAAALSVSRPEVWEAYPTRTETNEFLEDKERDGTKRASRDSNEKMA